MRLFIFSALTLLFSPFAAAQTQTLLERFNSAFLPIEQAASNAVPESVSYEERVHQAFEALQKDPASSIDLEALRRMAMDDGLEKDPDLRACAYAAYTISVAMAGDNPGYLRLFETFSTTYTNHVMVAQINPQALTGACPQCHGQNIRTVRCLVCKNSGKCAKCFGSGKVNAKPGMSKTPTSLGAMGVQRVPCDSCEGSGKCPACVATRVSCPTCANSGITPNKGKMLDAFNKLLDTGEQRSLQRIAQDLKERAASIAVMRAVVQAKRTRDPKKAMEMLGPLSVQYPDAPELPAITETMRLLEADAADREYNAPHRVRLREDVKAAIQRAQNAKKPEEGIRILNEAQERFAAADNAADLNLALAGLEKERTRRNEEASKTVNAAIDRIQQLSDPQEALAQIDHLLKTTDNENLKARIKNTRANIEIAANQKAAQKRKWMIAGGVAAVVLLLVGMIAFSISHQIKERKRKARAASANRFPFRIPPSDSDPFAKKKK